MVYTVRRGRKGATKWIVVIAMVCAAAGARAADAPVEPQRPNVLWITLEDISPNLGCYGDTYAVTPHMDRLAAQGVRFTRAYSNAGVCAVARTTLITGMYPTSLGMDGMRCRGTPPAFVEGYPTYLRRAGYYCTHGKLDYNWLNPPMKKMWDTHTSPSKWHRLKSTQPFFAEINIMECHESRLREPEYSKMMAEAPHASRHDPAKAHVPAYMPDTPEVRTGWAHSADAITQADRRVGVLLRQLHEAGLADDTIVFVFSDHGSGMPRSKRWCYDSSTRVPVIVRVPKKFQHLMPPGDTPGSTDDRLVSFVDFAPTLLNLCGVKAPAYMPGQPFLGPNLPPDRTLVYTYRGRMDERTDLIRAVRDKRFNYIRNYHPERSWFNENTVAYNFATPALQSWQHLADAGKLTGAPAIFMAHRKPVEELYDDDADPEETHNLASDPRYAEVLTRMRAALRRWEHETIDLGFIPEADLRSRFAGVAAYDAVRKDPSLYPLDRIEAAVDLANQMAPANAPKLATLLGDADPTVRYWAAIGLGAIGKHAAPATDALRTAALHDHSDSVRIAAAEALAGAGQTDEAVPVLIEMLKSPREWTRLAAANAVDRLGSRARAALPVVRRLLTDSNKYVQEIAAHAVPELSP